MFSATDNAPMTESSWWTGPVAFLAVEDQTAGVGLQGASDDVQECRLPRAILAHEGDDLAAIKVEADILQYRDAAEAFCDMLHRQGRFRCVLAQSTSVILMHVHPPSTRSFSSLPAVRKTRRRPPNSPGALISRGRPRLR
jgi:hypothetical protein